MSLTEIKKRCGRLVAGFLVAALAACGGGGGGSGTPVGTAPGTGPTFQAAKITLEATPSSLPSAGGNVQVSATVKNSADGTLSGQTIAFTVESGTLQNAQATTDSNGVATVTVNPGADRSNRNIVVTAKAGSVSNTISIGVTGTKLTLTGPATIALGAGGVTYTVRSVDSAGAPISGATVNVSSSLGNTLSAASVTTDANGFAQISYIPVRSGADVLTVAGLGASAQQSIAVGGASKIDLSANAGSIATAGGSVQGSVLITATVKNADNSAVASQPVTFIASSGALVGAQATTNASGAATVTLTPGSDRSNRIITVTATSGSATAVVNVQVVGSELTLSGASSLLASAGPTVYSVRAKDSAGSGIGGATVLVSSALGNPLSASSLVTDATGFAQFVYTPTKLGIDSLSVSGIGQSTQLAVTVSGQDFAFVSPLSAASVPTGVGQVVTVRLRNGPDGVPGQAVSFATTRGSVSPANTVTDASGVATANVLSTTAGPATLTASVGTVIAATQQINFVATVPATVVLQANPTAVLPNAAGTNANRAVLTAVVRDAIGNPVQSAVVNFSSVDPSGGTISPATGVTDASGQVQSSFIPGGASTGTNAVTVTASLANNPGITSSAKVTVNGRALFITIGTGNLIEVPNTTTYSKPFSVYVTDSNGAAVVSQPVVLTVSSEAYAKGQYMVSTPAGAGAPVWTRMATAACANEDLNRNGILDPGEDTNGDGRLTPGNVAVVSKVSVTTDATGFASFNVLYGKQFATWVSVSINASASVAGTESTSQYGPFALPVLAADVSDVTISPPNQRSPFGQSSSCTNAQ